jgi:large subunit ribosomal protein L3
MVRALLGKKLGMTRLFGEGGRSIPVTVIKVGPCYVVQKKTLEKEGYNAVQLGFEVKKENKVNKPLLGHFKKAGTSCFAYLREVKVEDPSGLEVGQEFRVDLFNIGDKVNVRGISKGRGFQGTVKRWGFGGGRASHGSKFHRAPGSIGCNTTPGRVIKGRRLPGRMGASSTTIRNLDVVDVRPELDILVVKGAVPGARNGLLEIMKV